MICNLAKDPIIVSLFTIFTQKKLQMKCVMELRKIPNVGHLHIRWTQQQDQTC